MGLLSALAGLPLAPLKGLLGLARYVEQQAEQERQRELAELQAELLELEVWHDGQGVEEEEFVRKEAELLEKIGALVGAEADGERE